MRAARRYAAGGGRRFAAPACAVVALVAATPAVAQTAAARAPHAAADRAGSRGGGARAPAAPAAQPTAPPARAVAGRPPARRSPHRLRAVVELAATLAGGAAWYWIDRDRQVADWDFPSVEQRLTFEAWRYDHNPFPINFIAHPLNGAAWHVIARSNGFGKLSAVGYGLATSLAWEFGLEFREKVSVNDVIATTAAGVAIGEFAHLLGRFLAAPGRPAGPLAAAARWTVGLGAAGHAAIDGAAPAPVPWVRLAGGATSARWRASGDAPGGAWTTAGVRFRGELVDVADFGSGRPRAGWFAAGSATSLEVAAATGGGGYGVDVYAEVVPAGYRAQRDGRALVVGPAVAYRYRKHAFPMWNDRLGVVHLPGPAVAAWWTRRTWRASVAARASADFAGVDANAFAAWRADHPSAYDRTILHKHGYYYGWGGSARLRAEVAAGRAALGAVVQAAAYASDEGLDRNQEEIDLEAPARDTAVDAEAWARWRAAETWYVELRGHWGRRDERIAGGYRYGASMSQWSLSVGAAR
ncbi:MAG: DUF3943 domain-containing protein [Deltaproteobacteria bacterium]|nr:MAG: DUF3943 domain-containing protein [Deltaproteobacteria bacterium]